MSNALFLEALINLPFILLIMFNVEKCLFNFHKKETLNKDQEIKCVSSVFFFFVDFCSLNGIHDLSL